MKTLFFASMLTATLVAGSASAGLNKTVPASDAPKACHADCCPHCKMHCCEPK